MTSPDLDQFVSECPVSTSILLIVVPGSRSRGSSAGVGMGSLSPTQAPSFQPSLPGSALAVLEAAYAGV